jgi:hypothetical protein
MYRSCSIVLGFSQTSLATTLVLAGDPGHTRTKVDGITQIPLVRKEEG